MDYSDIYYLFCGRSLVPGTQGLVHALWSSYTTYDCSGCYYVDKFLFRVGAVERDYSFRGLSLQRYLEEVRIIKNNHEAF